MSEWTRIRLGDAINIKHGYAFKGEYFSEIGPGPLLVTPGNFAIGGGFQSGKQKYYVGPIPDGFVLEPGDLVVTMTDLSKAGDTLGYPAIVPDDKQIYLHNQRVGLVEVMRPDLIDRVFLYYSLRTRTYRSYVLAAATGSTVRHTSPSRICDYSLQFPDLPTQRSLAAILKALDDKIAVNERIADTSLKLADAYFEADAADLRTGPLTFGEAAQVFGGGTPRTSEPSYWDGSIAWTTPSDVTALRAPYLFDTARKITDAGLRECASQLYPAGSIFMTSRATIGAFAVPQVPAAVNQGFIVAIPPSEEWRWWLFHEMRSRVDEMISLANGSTFLELSRKNFKVMPVRIPEPDRLARFARTVDPLHKRAAECVQENRVLADLRDTLLPGLMSGAIRVRDAEKAVEEAT